jgi:hypothetical protein
MSRVDSPREYRARIFSSNPTNRRWRLWTIFGSKLPSRSRGVRIACCQPTAIDEDDHRVGGLHAFSFDEVDSTTVPCALPQGNGKTGRARRECRNARRVSRKRSCRPVGLIVLCWVHSSRRESGSGRWARSICCRQVWQRPVQHLKIGCISSTAFGRVRPAAGEKGSAARA